MSVKLKTNPDLVELSINFSPVCSLISFSDLTISHSISIVSSPSILRNDGTTLLHGLQQCPLSDPQDGHHVGGMGCAEQGKGKLQVKGSNGAQ